MGKQIGGLAWHIITPCRLFGPSTGAAEGAVGGQRRVRNIAHVANNVSFAPDNVNGRCPANRREKAQHRAHSANVLLL